MPSRYLCLSNHALLAHLKLFSFIGAPSTDDTSSPTTVLNLGFGSQTKEQNFWLGSRNILGLGLVVRLQYLTSGWVVRL